LGDRVVLHSRAADRTPTLFMTFPGRDARRVAAALADRDVLAPAGTFYAYETFRTLGLDVDCGLRVGVAPYTDDADVDRLLDGLAHALSSPTLG
ncbi:MAG TPA: cysteine desulfurase-like protein, partial [Janibacter terrae]|nr:cysteine desulfurase-like protein [Janibacter terrae]